MALRVVYSTGHATMIVSITVSGSFPDQLGNNHVGPAASISEFAGMNHTETSHIDNSYSSA